MKSIVDQNNLNTPPKRHRSGGITFIKSTFSILILSAFVLVVAFTVKQLSLFDATSISKIFSKIGYTNPRAEKVAGDFIKRVTDVGVENEHELNISSGSKSSKNSGNNVIDGDIGSAKTTRNEIISNKELVLKIGVASDSHLSKSEAQYEANTTYLKTLFGMLKSQKITDLLFLGDLTNYGDLPSLKLGYDLLQDSGLNYKILPGDRDLAASVGIENYLSVFNSHNYSFELQGYKFVMLDNSANYTTISQDIIKWFDKEVATADFVLLSQPIYTEGLTLFSNVYMGSTMSTPEDPSLLSSQADVKTQRNLILSLIRASNVKAVIAGDHHKSSMVADKIKPELQHYVVGAVGGNVSEYSQKSLQTQRFSILEIYKDGTFSLQDVVLN